MLAILPVTLLQHVQCAILPNILHEIILDVIGNMETAPEKQKMHHYSQLHHRAQDTV